ncbi:sugar ABC transporter substrate-binding protein [Rathayibacter caricis DSM 15933]|uniref:Sugar ABC transporter substrate-binding protein n=2 Tax=Rathayibacter TaxID=33886 RepID=A0A2T4UQL0_9MICO|nr:MULTISPECIES: substrate-binding domain-containing protein [Rathayibacter]KQQ20623.1 sugar ABC transporter substrate-binding protein [Rathayibacter sp. Leaf299]MCJ1697478.1 substrate-binding domain-containing protein [Rathayibacter caricis]PTL71807.1 sugar ABC transporter substrate-binding protein [Rathayibacter caricis DSM 15933]
MFRKITAGAVTLVAAAALLTGCASTAGGGEDGEKTVGLAVANLQADFFNQIRQSVEAEAEAQGVKVIVSDAKGDSDTQVSQIQDFITQGVSAIIYIPAGATAATVPVRAANSAGIPIVTVDRNPEGSPGDTFIATDSVAAAEALGDWVVEQTGGEANIGVIQGQVGTTPELARDEGFTTAIEKAPGMKEVARQASLQWAQDEGYDIATDMLQSNPDITVFFGRADALALGASAAARAAGRDDILVVGFDGDKAGLEAVKDGTLGATITQPTQGMGKLALESALELADGGEVPAEQLQEGVLTTKDNVEPFITTHP